jgi:hypothetical protein
MPRAGGHRRRDRRLRHCRCRRRRRYFGPPSGVCGRPGLRAAAAGQEPEACHGVSDCQQA